MCGLGTERRLEGTGDRAPQLLSWAAVHISAVLGAGSAGSGPGLRSALVDGQQAAAGRE